MATPAIPTNLQVSQANSQVYLLWDITAGATNYQIQRSIDGVNYSNLTTSPTFNYLDTTVDIGTEYWYQVAAVNGSGMGLYTPPQSIIPSPSGELSLQELRTRSQQKADRLNSNFVELTEWNMFINLAMYELYDLLVTTYQDLFLAPALIFSSDGTTFEYPLPDGVLYNAAPKFHKLLGVDLGINQTNNAWVSINKFNFKDRNRFIYPNTASTIYGVFNLRYRLMGDKLYFIPTPTAGQQFRIWYIPRLPELLQETDITTLGYTGWLDYVITRAAKYALDKEESDTTKLDQELMFLKGRIEESATNRDAGDPNTITDSRGANSVWGYNGPMPGFNGGY